MTSNDKPPIYVRVYDILDQVDIETRTIPLFSPIIQTVSPTIVDEPFTARNGDSLGYHIAAIDPDQLDALVATSKAVEEALTPIFEEQERAQDAFDKVERAHDEATRTRIERIESILADYDATSEIINDAIYAFEYESRQRDVEALTKEHDAKEARLDEINGPRAFKINIPKTHQTIPNAATIHQATCNGTDNTYNTYIARPNDIITLVEDAKLPRTTPYDRGRTVASIKICRRCKPDTLITELVPEVKDWHDNYLTERDNAQPALPPKAQLRTTIAKFQKVLPWRIMNAVSGFDVVRPDGTDSQRHGIPIGWFNHGEGPDPMSLDDINHLLARWGWVARQRYTPAKPPYESIKLDGCYALRRMTPAEKRASTGL